MSSRIQKSINEKLMATRDSLIKDRETIKASYRQSMAQLSQSIEALEDAIEANNTQEPTAISTTENPGPAPPTIGE